jgi:hypothetical protein
MGRHSRGVVERRGKQALAIAAAAGSEGLGVALISWGNHLSAENYYYDVVPWGFWGAVFIALPVIALANRVVAGIARAVAAEHRRYREWKAGPAARAAGGGRAGRGGGGDRSPIAMWEHHKRVDARLTSSVMGYTMPDGHIPRPSDRIAAYRQQAALHHPAPQQLWTAPDMTPDPHAAARQKTIARFQPEHIGHDGTYRAVPYGQ